MSSIRRIPGDTARRQQLRRFKLDFRTTLDGDPYDISAWTDVQIDVFDSRNEIAVTWSIGNYLTRPANDQLLIDAELSDDVDLPEAAQYFLDIFRVTNAGKESFASMTLWVDKRWTGEYQKAPANSEVIYINFSSLAPGTTVEASSALSARVDSLETQVANFVQGQLLFAIRTNYTALAAMTTPLADTYVTVLNTVVISGETLPKGQYLLRPTNQIIYCLTGDEYRPASI